MKRFLHFKSFAAMAVCLVMAMSASAYDFEKDGIYYNVSGTNAVVTYKDANYNSYSGTVIIPATVTNPNNGTTYPVKTIGVSAFQGSYDLKRVVIPNSVEYIMNYAFKNCLDLPNITIPASVFTIYNNVFEGCTRLRSVICLNATPRSWYANNFSDVTYSNATLYVPQGSKEAYQSSTYCWGSFVNIEEIECDFVQDAIFYKDLGNNRAAVRGVALYASCYSGEIVIPSTVTNGGNTYTVTSVAKGAFYYGEFLTSVSLPNTVNEIDTYAFYSCGHLTNVNIPEGVTRLRYCTFGCCSSLPSITIPASVTYIEEGTFHECTGLETITCCANTPPECPSADSFDPTNYENATLRVPYNALNAYKSATAWKEFSHFERYFYNFVENGIYYIITGPNTVSVSFKDQNYNSYSGSVNVPATVVHEGTSYTVTAIGRAAFYKCTGLTSVTLPNTITEIGYAAFYQCSALTSINIPSGVTTLGNFCFMSCTSLQNITLPNGITDIPVQCFLYCASLTSINIPGTVKEIANFAFYGCDNLESVTLQNGVERILQDAFSACISLQTMTYPASVTMIVTPVLDDCYSLTTINVDPANTHYRSVDGVLFTASMDTLVRFPQNKPLSYYQIPAGVKVIGYMAFKDCNMLQSVVIPQGATEIEFGGFYGCTSLEGIDVPNGVTSIGTSAFYDCSSMTYVNLPSTLTSLSYYAFHGVPDLTQINVKATTPPVCKTYVYEANDEVEVVEPFMEDHYSNVNLLVPLGCATLYRHADVWKKFTNITETEFPADFIHGDVNNDSKVNISDVTALINYLLSNNDSAINLQAADTNQDGKINISDVTTLINYLLSGNWPTPAPIDMWYLIGTHVGSNQWENEGVSSIGTGLIPLFPVGDFDGMGRGLLTYTGYFGENDAIALLHTPGSWEDGWGIDDGGNYARGYMGDGINAFTVGASGYFTITLDTRTDEFHVTPYDASGIGVFNTISMPGEHCYWMVTDTQYNMTDMNPSKENHDWIFRNFALDADGQLKFAADNDWEFNWGENKFPWGRGTQGGQNIPVKAGTYNVYFNDITGDFNFIPAN